MKLPFFKKKKQEPTPGMIKQQIIPKGVSSHVSPKEEINNQAKTKTAHDEPKLVLKPEVVAFLQRHDSDPDKIDMKALTERFHAAMEAGLRGEKDGLPMLPTYLTAEGSKLPENQVVAVLDAGGTNLRVARVWWKNGNPQVTDSETMPLPGSTEPVTWSKFIKQCADALEPRLEGTTQVGVCFCYPAHATPEGDLKVIEMTKEVQIKGCKDKMVVASLAKELEKRGHTGLTFTALNDTPAALLRGRTGIPQGYSSDFAGMVLGTGMNTAVRLPVSRIEKLGQPESTQRMIVNMESGSFTGMPQGDFDKALDAATDNPGAYLFEKMTAGRYLGELCRLALKAAAQEGLFHDEEVAKKVKNIRKLDCADLDAFALNPDLKPLRALANAGEEDVTTAAHIVTAMFWRSSKFITCCCTALAKLTGLAQGDRYKPVIICVDGSLFNKSMLLHHSVTLDMQDFTVQDMALYAMCKGVEQATLIGTAAAALLEQA